MHRRLETGNAFKEKIGVLVPHKLDTLQLRRKQMLLGWLKGECLHSHRPQSIRNGVTLVKTIFERGAGSSFTNLTPCPSVLRDKSLAEMAKKVSVVRAADYSYWWSVRGACVAQALLGYKNIKTSLPGDVYIRRTFHRDFWYSTPRNIRQTLPQATNGTHPTCPHGAHSRSSGSSAIR